MEKAYPILGNKADVVSPTNITNYIKTQCLDFPSPSTALARVTRLIKQGKLDFYEGQAHEYEANDLRKCRCRLGGGGGARNCWTAHDRSRTDPATVYVLNTEFRVSPVVVVNPERVGLWTGG
jgi:hypothetical protein